MGPFLIIQTAFIGDAVLATAVVEKLHEHYPDSCIDLLVRKGNEVLFEEHPFIDDVLVWNKEQRKYRDLYRLYRKIRRSEYGTVIDLQRFFATGFLTAFSKARQRLGYRKNPWSSYFTERIPHHWNSGQHEVERALGTIEGITDQRFVMPRLYPSERALKQTEDLRDTPYYCIAPTSVWSTKQWPMEKWVELMDRLPSGKRIILLGGPADKDACEWIARSCNRADIIIAAGSYKLMESAALIRDAERLFANDSAPVHIASALDTATTAVFCSTLPSFGFTPLAKKSSTIEREGALYCRPCGMHGKKACPEGHFRCAWEIEVQKLLATAEGSSRQ